jgi:hypothetical protein
LKWWSYRNSIITKKTWNWIFSRCVVWNQWTDSLWFFSFFLSVKHLIQAKYVSKQHWIGIIICLLVGMFGLQVHLIYALCIPTKLLTWIFLQDFGQGILSGISAHLLATKIVARNQANTRIWWETSYLTGLPLDGTSHEELLCAKWRLKVPNRSNCCLWSPVPPTMISYHFYPLIAD